jgi:RHS repeat-associated protein
VNAAGDVVQAYNYDSSGDALDFTPSGAITDYLYDQQYYDVISGQYYMRARNYYPATGTFTQQDSYTIYPGDLANANLYLFAGADPINMFDPSGRFGLMSTLGAISLTSFLAGGVGAAFGGAEHGLKGVETGFIGAAAGTATTLSMLTGIALFAPVLEPVAAPLAFELGGAMDAVVQDIGVTGLGALDHRKTWEDAASGFIVGAAFGAFGDGSLYYINREVAGQFDSMPPVWDVLGNIQRGGGVLTPRAAESGLLQNLPTLFKLYVPELFAIGRDLVADEATGGFRNLAVIPVAQVLVHFVDITLLGNK